MSCCCFPCFRRKKISSDNEIKSISSSNFTPSLTWTCENSASTTTASPFGSKNNSVKLNDIEEIEKYQFNTTRSYVNANSFVNTEDESIEVDYTEDSTDIIQEARHSIDTIEASDIILSDSSYTNFHDTIRDSSLNYQDISGLNQTMRRYSSAVADRSGILVEKKLEIELDFEPLNLSLIEADSTNPVDLSYSQ